MTHPSSRGASPKSGSVFISIFLSWALSKGIVYLPTKCDWIETYSEDFKTIKISILCYTKGIFKDVNLPPTLKSFMNGILKNQNEATENVFSPMLRK